MKDRLIELCENIILSCKANLCSECEHNNHDYPHCMNVHFADHLLENGVIVPPYKVGTRIYAVVSRTSDNKNFYIVEDEITHYRIVDGLTIMCLKEHLGLPDFKWDKVFSTREEAEAKLKEGGQE